MGVTSRIYVCDMTHLWVGRDSFMCVTKHIAECDMTRLWVIYACDITHLLMWHASSMSETWLIHASDDSCMSVIWLIYVCAVWNIQAYIFPQKKIIQKQFYEYHVTHSLWMSRNSFMRVMTHAWVSCDSFMCVQWDIFRRTFSPIKKKSLKKNAMNITSLSRYECHVTHSCE